MPEIEMAKNAPFHRGVLSRPPAVGVVVVGVLATAVLLGGQLFTPTEAIAPPAGVGAVASADPMGNESAIYVHVAGAVRSPGLHILPIGARVADAIEAAGGPRRGADLDLLNLAQVLTDGTRVEVQKKGAASVTVVEGGGEVEGPVSLNQATSSELEELPGIGPVRAAAIVAYREDHGGFVALEDLLEVSGIGPAIYASLREHVTL